METFKGCVELYHYQPSAACAIITWEGQVVRFVNRFFLVTQRVKSHTVKEESLAMDVVARAAGKQNFDIHSCIFRRADTWWRHNDQQRSGGDMYRCQFCSCMFRQSFVSQKATAVVAMNNVTLSMVRVKRRVKVACMAVVRVTKIVVTDRLK